MRRSKSLGEFVPEIERFLHKRKRVARNNIAMAERTLKEYATPSTEEPQAIIVYPTVEGNNFEINPALLNLVQQNQFSGSPAEDPNLHNENTQSSSSLIDDDVIEFTTDEPVNQVDTEVPHLDDISEVNYSDHDNAVSDYEEEVEIDSPEEEEPYARTINPPGYLKDYITGGEAEENDLQNGLAMFNTSFDPSTFDEASKLKVWKEAMKQEIEAIESNNAWELTDLPTGCKKIGVKWIYKTKLNEKGEVEKYKARLVAKGYAQKLGIDYNEVFAPVARWDTIRTILAVVAYRGWKVY